MQIMMNQVRIVIPISMIRMPLMNPMLQMPLLILVVLALMKMMERVLALALVQI